MFDNSEPLVLKVKHLEELMVYLRNTSDLAITAETEVAIRIEEGEIRVGFCDEDFAEGTYLVLGDSYEPY